MLIKKQQIEDNAVWLRAFEDCTKSLTREEIAVLEYKTIALIRKTAQNYCNACSGWIAGKDSLALDHILRKSGIRYTPIMWRGVNEYPSMTRWIAANKPYGLIEEVIDKYSLPFLEKHPEYLFCSNGTRQKWMATKWARQRKDISKHGFDLFITGRRLKDGNICGSKESGYVTRKPNATYASFSPLAEWTHEQLLAYIKYENIALPPFYSYERGFLIGSVAMGEWTERPMLNKTEDEVWDELYAIDPTIVTNASRVLTKARRYLEKRGFEYET